MSNATTSMSSASTSFVLKGDIAYSRTPSELATTADGYLICVDGLCQGVYSQLPEQYSTLELRDNSGQLIIPGFVDLHTHAPQYSYRGTGMDLELLDWLQTYTYPEEARYHELDYAQRLYPAYVAGLAAGATTRASIFSTVHVPATMLLMDLLENSGLVTFVGKVNMDRNAPDELRETSAAVSLASTRSWLAEVAGREYARTRPILTPRFTPSCSDELMLGLGQIQGQFGADALPAQPPVQLPAQPPVQLPVQLPSQPPAHLPVQPPGQLPVQLPVQSHLSENLREIEWVRQLCPKAQNYADTYYASGLLGGSSCPTIMAHCVHCSSQELDLLQQQGVWIAHCAESNTNLASGIAPVRTYLEQGLRIGLGTDVAGGSSLSVSQAMVKSIQASKLRWRYVDDNLEPLTLAEAFYLATLGGGSFWGQVGSFEPGFEFDAVVLNDSKLHSARAVSIPERLEQLIYSNADLYVSQKYVRGTLI